MQHGTREHLRRAFLRAQQRSLDELCGVHDLRESYLELLRAAEDELETAEQTATTAA